MQTRKKEGGLTALTRSLKVTAKTRAERDAAFRDARSTKAVDQLLAGDLGSTKAILRDDTHATIGFEGPAAETACSSNSLMRLFSLTGHLTAAICSASPVRCRKPTGGELVVVAGS